MCVTYTLDIFITGEEGDELCEDVQRRDITIVTPRSRGLSFQVDSINGSEIESDSICTQAQTLPSK